ncbi:DNA-methyltransferase [Streptacidiphilus jiangxiensis]|uniref:Methyltransferase n=1 Tax=Streptacidiphilus jiangxiensis TaxID=235985 RepID=A0A1H8A6P0_STRJI|nr:site-specific DNA-methyltransferase [Streptacidiphilus jiangxiensis]SEM66223.1 site-specific DNA-methyltransferase (adenine-specific) [Streptacidiphilus jiangxiensis]
MTYTLHRGDALSVLAQLPDNSVDAVITDPPYNSGGRTAKERTSRTAKQKYTSNDAKHDLPDFPGENKDQRSYGFWMTLLLTEAYRVCREGGVLLVFTDWRQSGVTEDALQAGGWLWRGIVPWHKPQARPQTGRFTQNCEFVYWGSKGAIDGSRNPVHLPGWYSASQPSGRERVHITQKPVSVMRDLVKICVPGGVVLDPFAGSGSTGVAALLEGRDFVGVELARRNYRNASRRLAETEAELRARQE